MRLLLYAPPINLSTTNAGHFCTITSNIVSLGVLELLSTFYCNMVRDKTRRQSYVRPKRDPPGIGPFPIRPYRYVIQGYTALICLPFPFRGFSLNVFSW